MNMSAVDYFLRLEGIDGESPDPRHKNEIEIESWNWGTANGGTQHSGGGGGAGKCKMEDFQFTMPVSKASPKLMLACACGTHIKTAVLTCRKAGDEQMEYYTITMTGVLVSSFRTGGTGAASVVPIDQVALNFGQIELEYKPQTDNGSLGAAIKAGYSPKENKKV
jgi:type VI secretion system secreted protein Hcp